MMRMLLAGSVVALALVGSHAPRAFAAEDKVVRGTIDTVTPNAISIKAGSQEMKFTVDAKTHVEATGAGTKSRAAQAAGRAGAQVTELLKPGQAVEITYDEMNGGLHAARVRAISRVSTADPSGASEARGKVTAVSAMSVSIAGSSGPATFTQTYSVDANTHIVGKGVGTKMAASGGRTSITDVVAVGDTVSISYKPGGNAPHAAEIRVIGK